MNSKNKLNFLILLITALISLSFVGCAKNENTRTVDLASIQQKIDAGEIKHLTIKKEEIVVIDLAGIEYRAPAANEFFKTEIMKKAMELDANGKRKVEKVDELSGGNNQFFGISIFWIISPLVIASGITGFILGRVTKTLR